MKNRDIEKTYTADCIEKNENFRISVAGEAIYVPDKARYNIEHERSDGSHEIEFQIKWED